MAGVAYTVSATFPDEGMALEYIAWLHEGHVGEVVAHGADSGMILRVMEPPEPIRIETRYMFPNRAAYQQYVERHAPGLRAEGLRRFGHPGVSFERRTSAVIWPVTAPNKVL